jgi:hypothetical protein
MPVRTTKRVERQEAGEGIKLASWMMDPDLR